MTASPLSSLPETAFYGSYGGQFVPDCLKGVLDEVAAAFAEACVDEVFCAELNRLYVNYSGRPTPVFHAINLERHLGGAQIWLKREDLNHLGAHKINNSLGQALLARRMGKTKLVAETGAGQHGVATAAAAALKNA